MDQVKEAFQRVKEDIFALQNEIASFKQDLGDIRQELVSICQYLEKLSEKVKTPPQIAPTQAQIASTQDPPIQTTQTHISTDIEGLEPLKPQNQGISTGNGGVPTDKQTNQQTNRHTYLPIKTGKLDKPDTIPAQDPIKDASEILDSLGELRKEIRLKFKRLTEQEILVFSTIYQLEEDQGQTDYKAVSEKLKLSESSIRDYVGRLIKKGIPVEKKRINNKNIALSISEDLKKLAPLNTILKLRDL